MITTYNAHAIEAISYYFCFCHARAATFVHPHPHHISAVVTAAPKYLAQATANEVPFLITCLFVTLTGYKNIRSL